MPKIVFQKVCVLGEQYLLEHLYIRGMDAEDSVQKGTVINMPVRSDPGSGVLFL